MNKILGLDLGTNSVGWALRDTTAPGNQIIDKGVLTFEKGVGEGKSGEFPLVQKRTESRSKRRHYQAEKYRKWALLQALINHHMCPLTHAELDEWRKYTKGTPRKYPQSEKFIQWLRYDFDGDGLPDFERLGFSKHENHYLFRMLAVSEKEEHQTIFKDDPTILGRVLYHMVQRRGFRGRDEEEAKTIMQGSKDSGTVGVDAIVPYLQRYETLGAALYYLQKSTGERIRKRYNLRSDYERELKIICQRQHIDEELYKAFWKAIIWQRPLRSQKGLVGVCTFESGKTRCPVSHPLYEEYRTWVAITNLKIKFDGDAQQETLLAEKVYPLFCNASRDFKLISVAKVLRRFNGKITAKTGSDADKEKEKYKQENTRLVSATLLHQLETILGPDWQERYGWREVLHNQPKTCPYSIEDIWHVLFTFDDREKLKSFAREKLQLEEEAAEKFSKIKLTQGYATLSLAAIKKILPYLQQGFLYSRAVYLANVHKVLGIQHITRDEANNIGAALEHIFHQADNEKKLIAAVNDLINDRLNSGSSRFGMDPSYQLDNDDKKDIFSKLEALWGEQTWAGKSDREKKEGYDFVARHYLAFLQKPIQYSKQPLFLKSSRQHDRIFQYLQDTYGAQEKNKKYLWHPSEQETYEPGKAVNGIPQLGSPIPISRGFKNPMALKTLHKLKKLINFLLVTGKIDEDTRVVVEIARELNDANKRKAIEKWQRDREKENEEYRARIKEIADEYYPGLDVNDKRIIDKYRLWIEQGKTCLYTGEMINCKDLFDGSKYDFEHTVPASISFDSELKNLTIANGLYNKQIKSNKLPSQLPNYTETLGYTAIRPRLQFMEEKVAGLQIMLEEWSNKTKFASTKDIKDACIQRRHLIRFELNYWSYKLHTFTMNEYKAGWRNSQLKDTQVVTKYALPYLKTVFQKVAVEKGSVVADFRNIYGLYPRKSKKDRDKHSHHAIDAAVLTLIPPAAIRDKILLNYNKAKDRDPNASFHEGVRNWSDFHPNHILSIADDVLINFQAQQRALTPTYKNVRKRGRQQYVKEKDTNGKWRYKVDEKGQRINLKAKGDSIRGQLHKESMFGMIQRNGEKWLVERYPISSFTSIKDCRNIIDDAVRDIVQKELEARMAGGESFDKAKFSPISFPSGKAVIKKVRCRVAAGRGYLTPGKALGISRRDSPSKHPYKQLVYAQNEENTLCLYYEGMVDEKVERGFRIIGLYDLAELKLRSFRDIENEKYYQTLEVGKAKKRVEIPLTHIITAGMRVILLDKGMDELMDLPPLELSKRVYRVYKFNEAPSEYMYLQHHLEARSNEELGKGDSSVDFTKFQPRLVLNPGKFICAMEGKDFSIDLDGQIRYNL